MIKHKKLLPLSCLLLIVMMLSTTVIALAAPAFKGLYDSVYDRADLNRFSVINNVVHDFEVSTNLMQNMQVENYKGKIEHNTDTSFVSNGRASMKATITNDAIVSAQTIKFKFDTGENAKVVEQIAGVKLDVFNANNYSLKIKPVIISTFASYFFPELALNANQLSTVTIDMTEEFKNYLFDMVGFSLRDVKKYEYRIIIPKGVTQAATVYFDNLRYTSIANAYTPPSPPQPMVRVQDEVNNFNAPHTVKYVTPEYEIGLQGFDNQNQFVHVDYSSDIRREGTGSCKYTIQGIDLGGFDATTYGYPALSLRRQTQIGATNLASYKTLSFWVYYDALGAQGSKVKNPDTIKFVFEHRNNYYPNNASIVPDIIIPKHKWVNIRINLDDSIFGLRDYTTALRFWTYGFNTTEVDRIVYFDNITLSTTALSSQELDGKKYVMTAEH